MDLNVREFPEDLQRKLKSKAALQGITMRELIISMLLKGLSCMEAKKARG